MPPELNLPQIEYNINIEDLATLENLPDLGDRYTYHVVETANNNTFTGGQEQVVAVGDPVIDIRREPGQEVQDGGLVTYEDIQDHQIHIHYEDDPLGRDRVIAADVAGERRPFVQTYNTAVGAFTTALNEMAERVNNGTATIYQTANNFTTTYTGNEWTPRAETAQATVNADAAERRLNDLDLFETLKPRINSYIEELLQQEGYIIGKVPEETSEIPVE